MEPLHEARKYIEREKPIDPNDPDKGVITVTELDEPEIPFWDRMKDTGPGDPKNPKGPGGRPKALSSPQELWEHACDYFALCDGTPWLKTDYKGKDADRVEIPNARPYTWGGFDEHLRSKNVIAKLEDYKANRKNDQGVQPYAQFSDVITRIRNIIRTQKLEGAMVGAFDARIVSAELALTQKVAVELPKQVFKIGDTVIEIA